MSDSVLVTGASSQLGVFLLPRLQQAGFRVLAVSRRAPRSAMNVSEQVAWQHPDSLLDETAAAECKLDWQPQHLVSCGPLDLACALITRQTSLKRLVAFSTSSVLTKTGSLNRGEKARMLKIQHAETQLQKLCEDRDIALVLLRPTLIYGCGLDKNISVLARFGCRFGFIPVSGNAAGLRQPVHADDLAAVTVEALSTDQANRLTSEVCGGSTLTYREMAEKIADCCGVKVRVLAIPPWLLIAAVQVMSIFPAYRAFNGEMVRRQGSDMVFDDTALRAALNYQPRAFNPSGCDFEMPENALKLQSLLSPPGGGT